METTYKERWVRIHASINKVSREEAEIAYNEKPAIEHLKEAFIETCIFGSFYHRVPTYEQAEKAWENRPRIQVEIRKDPLRDKLFYALYYQKKHLFTVRCNKDNYGNTKYWYNSDTLIQVKNEFPELQFFLKWLTDKHSYKEALDINTSSVTVEKRRFSIHNVFRKR